MIGSLFQMRSAEVNTTMIILQLLTAFILLVLTIEASAEVKVEPDVAAYQKMAEMHVQIHQREMLDDFKRLLSIPNVATNVDNMYANAKWIQTYVEQRGFESRVVEAGGSPYIVAERPGPEGAPTILIYAHFDGQPVIPADWASPPFEPTLWDRIPGEGATVLPFDHRRYDPEWRLVAR